MVTTLATVLLCLFLLLALPFSSAQQLSIATPGPGTKVSPGQTLEIKLNFQGSPNQIAFSTGFSRIDKNWGAQSLGRPYVGSVYPSLRGGGVVFDASHSVYSYKIQVPSADRFFDKFPAAYNLTVAQYFLAGALASPMVNIAAVPVNVV